MRQTFEDVRPDLKKYYKPEHNDGKLMSEIPNNYQFSVKLCCDICGTIKNCNPWSYCRFVPKYNNFNATFKCGHCNSLGEKHPYLIKEWHEKNDKTPFEVFPFSQKKYWWKCDKGHEWEAKIATRIYGGTNCPKCNFSHGELIIAKWLKTNEIEYVSQYHVKINKKSRRFDFYLPQEKIFVEVHGIQHFEDASSCKSFYAKKLSEQQEIDRQKQEYAEQNGKYIMVDYREHNPELALDRFLEKLEII